MRRTAFVLLLLAPGCALPPEEGPAGPEPVKPPARWTGRPATPAGRLADRWWQAFGDPDLDRIVRLTLERNPSLAAAEARLRQSVALARIAGADLVPQLGGGASAGITEAFTGTNPLFPSTSKNDSYGVSLNLSWEVDLWGRIRAGRDAARADLAAADALRHGARLSLAAQAAKAYLTLVEARGQVEVAERSLASARSLARRIKARFDRGLKTALDLKLAEADAVRAEADLATRRRALDAARRQLESLAGGYPAGAVRTDRELPPLPPPVPAGVPAAVLDRRPDLAAARAALEAAGLRVDQARAALYPRISLTGSAGLASTKVKDILDGDYGVWSLAANLVAPLVDGGRLREGVTLAQARRAEARAEFAAKVLQAFREVEVGLAGERHLVRRERALADLVRRTQANLDLSRERYLRGLVDVLTVLNSRQARFAAMSGLLDTRKRTLLARIDTCVALGGGFDRARSEGKGGR